MNDKIEQIKVIMTDIATGKADIQEKNNEYKQLFQELDNLFAANRLENPNDFSDLWEFYHFWKEQGMQHYSDRRAYIIKLYKNIKPRSIVVKSGAYNFVHTERIKELQFVKNSNFDTLKLVKYCEELNIIFANKCILSTAMLVRAIMDHIPPIFSKDTFTEVANNYGSRSIKESMKNLENSLRKISDAHLHTHIQKKEVLPSSNQVDFSNDLDVLLGEIYRALK